MPPTDLLRRLLDHLVRLARGRRGEAAAFRPRLELLESRAAPGGLTFAEPIASPPSSERAVVRVQESLVIDPRPLPALACRAFDDRLFGDESAERVAGKDLEDLFAGPIDFSPADLDYLSSALASGKDDTAFFFAQEAAASDDVFLGADW